MNPAVDAWLASTKNPKKQVIAAVRAVVLTDERIDEAIKYRAPAFLHGGIMAYFHWNAKDFASMIFPLGSRIPGDFELLEGSGLQRMIRFSDLPRSATVGMNSLTSLIVGVFSPAHDFEEATGQVGSENEKTVRHTVRRSRGAPSAP